GVRHLTNLTEIINSFSRQTKSLNHYSVANGSQRRNPAHRDAQSSANNLSQRRRTRIVRRQRRAVLLTIATSKANRLIQPEGSFHLVDFGSADGAFASEVSRTVGADRCNDLSTRRSFHQCRDRTRPRPRIWKFAPA